MSESKKKISIIIPAYNAEVYIEECAGYLINQTFEDFECVFVNDGSVDRTERFIKKVIRADKLKRFSYVTHRKNRGLPSARNTGFAQAKGEYVIFLDADDVFEPTMLEVSYGQARRTGADITVFNYDELKMGSGSRFKQLIDMARLPQFDTFSYDEIQPQPGRLSLLGNTIWNKLFKRTFIQENNLTFDEGLLRAEDLDYSLRAYMLAQKITFIDETLMTYRTQIATSNQGTLSRYPTALFNSLMNVHDFFVTNNLYKNYRIDLNDLACEHLLTTLRVNTPKGRHMILAEAKKFMNSYGFDNKYIDTRDSLTKSILVAIKRNDYTSYMDNEHRRLLIEKESLLSRIPPLEERIEVEVKELEHYRDNPSIRTAKKLLRRAMESRVRNVRPMRIVKRLIKR